MAMPLQPGKASPAEEEKLIEEIQHLIKEKQLNVKFEAPHAGTKVLSGCSTCTLCPCMICW
jgi:hypothetical protein